MVSVIINDNRVIKYFLNLLRNYRFIASKLEPLAFQQIYRTKFTFLDDAETITELLEISDIILKFYATTGLCDQDLFSLIQCLTKFVQNAPTQKIFKILTEFKPLIQQFELITIKKKDIEIELMKLKSILSIKMELIHYPNSADKKVFQQFINSTNNKNSSAKSPGANKKKQSTQNGDDEFVRVQTPWKFRPEKLTDHQLEKMKERKIIPALYNDTSQSQSQDTQNISTWCTPVAKETQTDVNSNKQTMVDISIVETPEEVDTDGVLTIVEDNPVTANENNNESVMTTDNVGVGEVTPPQEEEKNDSTDDKRRRLDTDNILRRSIITRSTRKKSVPEKPAKKIAIKRRRSSVDSKAIPSDLPTTITPKPVRKILPKPDIIPNSLDIIANKSLPESMDSSDVMVWIFPNSADDGLQQLDTTKTKQPSNKRKPIRRQSMYEPRDLEKITKTALLNVVCPKTITNSPKLIEVTKTKTVTPISPSKINDVLLLDTEMMMMDSDVIPSTNDEVVLSNGNYKKQKLDTSNINHNNSGGGGDSSTSMVINKVINQKNKSDNSGNELVVTPTTTTTTAAPITTNKTNSLKVTKILGISKSLQQLHHQHQQLHHQQQQQQMQQQVASPKIISSKNQVSSSLASPTTFISTLPSATITPIQKTNNRSIQSSPECDKEKIDDLLNSTLDISPIATGNKSLNYLSPAPAPSPAIVNTFPYIPSTLNIEQNNASTPVRVIDEQIKMSAYDVNRKTNSMFNTKRLTNSPVVNSGGKPKVQPSRGWQLIDMVMQNKTSDIGVSSPKQQQQQKIKQSESPIVVTPSGDYINSENLLTFTRELPSPYASPNVSILKRKFLDDNGPDNSGLESPLLKVS